MIGAGTSYVGAHTLFLSSELEATQEEKEEEAMMLAVRVVIQAKRNEDENSQRKELMKERGQNQKRQKYS